MAILQKKKAADITDEEVVESYELPCPPLPFYFLSMLQTILLLEGVVGHLEWCLGHLISHHLTPTPEHSVTRTWSTQQSPRATSCFSTSRGPS